MKKTGIFFLSLVLCVGLFSVSKAMAEQNPTICAVHPFTGRFAFAGIHGADAMEDAIGMANAEGGVNGKKIEYYWADGEYKNDVGIAAFKRLYAQHKPHCMWAQSTGMTKALAPEINSRYKVLYSAYTFAEMAANPKENPYMFLAGPTYAEMFAVLLKYIAKEKPGANIAFFYSDTEFGREPIPAGRELCKKMGLKLVAEEISKVGGVDISTQILDMKRKKVDYCIFQGFVVTPIQTVIKQAKDYAFKCKFMGTFWSTEKHLLDQLKGFADQYMGVTAYSYYYQDEFPMIKKIRAWNKKHHPKFAEYRSQAYMQVFMGTTLFVEALRRADKTGAITGDSLAKAIQSIKNFDVGGLMPPVTIKNNSIPVGRVVRGNLKTLKFDPVSDWISLD
ncbi:MAG: ABC transporter substrate-binding protein [Deltaproteobacteria bacterium]|nr:ABC transporter substrate-binding protein [Deltaproteobacteria bacterium]MBW1737564.1 ABC transporter substrate-binding protein [Deltaproteobacteria bacterium]MBW1910097.1 ABC transporter substrate-binding protein [Deltaproteobacteria bacterium]MBW2034550.1 ABC transporter substrate-binding protein [Deltaproteobacteria bacterium]MBW2114798.1 ABC transporter substrate-binding protein [Deltaproteobacteria bacterium]